MLRSVSNEIRSHLRYYTDFEELQLKVDKWDTTIYKQFQEIVLSEDECHEIIKLM